MTVNGNLDNSYQDESFSLRYTFEVTNLEYDDGSGRDSGDNSMKNFLPKTGEEKMAAASLLGTVMLLSLLVFLKKRKKKETDQ